MSKVRDMQTAKRELLETAVIQAALNLFAYTGATSFKLPVPHTTPQLYVAAGEGDIFEDKQMGVVPP